MSNKQTNKYIAFHFVILINNRTAHSNASHPTSCVNFYLL